LKIKKVDFFGTQCISVLIVGWMTSNAIMHWQAYHQST